jgi:uncharacterized protein
MERLAFKKLLRWKDKTDRMPLIVRGARQVGKTFLLKEFGKTCFPRCHYINFENNRKFDSFFQESLDPKKILFEIELSLSQSIDYSNDLVIFDEIQECPRAITSLKYFQENLPQLALIAAGSLLGVHLNGVSFPVGKVEFLDMHPMTFREFLKALGDEKALEFLDTVTWNTTLPEMFHDTLWQKLKLYYVIGGLPDAVKTFLMKKERPFEALEDVREKQKALCLSYLADMAKHSGKVNALHLERLWRAIPSQLAKSEDDSSKRFIFKDVVPGVNRYNQLVSVIDWLEAAGLILKVKIAHSAKLPLSAFTKENIFKLFVFDIGILGALSELSPKIILDQTYENFKGYFAENYVAQEFVANSASSLYAWEEKTAEIEFLRVIEDEIIPIEVKSGVQTKAKSLSVFREKYQPPYEVIFSGKNLNVQEGRRRRYLPLYMSGWFPFVSGKKN